MAIAINNIYPRISLLHYLDPLGVWQFKIVLAGKEEEKLLELLLAECSNGYVALNNCYYLGRA